MRIERLAIDLRPRPHAQALDLGFALLRRHAGDVYRAWLAVWLPAFAFALLLAWLMPSYTFAWLLLPWWLRPALERAPLYVLSRAVFGERTAWHAALRAWPRQLKGGIGRMLTWWRPFMAGRALHHPVWQLEQVSGQQATHRRRVLAKRGTGRAAWLFGVACLAFEIVLYGGTIAAVSLFLPSNPDMNPFAALHTLDGGNAMALLQFGALAIAGGIVGPVYTACCFTLYLNRRATLEAWDIELVLRRMRPPGPGARLAGVLPLLAGAVLALALTAPPPVRAAELQCKPDWYTAPQRGPAHDAAQARLRAEIDAIYDEPGLRGYRCEEQWVLRDKRKRAPEKPGEPFKAPTWLGTAAQLIKALLIASAIGAAGWLLYRYRDRLPALHRAAPPAAATEVGGLDIRPDSLPDDVPAAARTLWQAGRQRAALALLYRATLARLVADDALHVHPGATEGDCLRLARAAAAAGNLGARRLAMAVDVTDLWLRGAYGARWPADDAFCAVCDGWRDAFAPKELPA